MKAKVITLIMALVAVVINAQATNSILKHLANEYEVHFTWDCYGEVNTLDEAKAAIFQNVPELQDSLQGLTFKLIDTITDGDRKHYYYRATNDKDEEMVISLFEIHTVTKDGTEKPYFAAGAADMQNRETIDKISPLIPEFTVPDGTMKQCEVETMYNGKQKMDYLETADGTGYLYDTNRKIYTFDSSYYTLFQQGEVSQGEKDSLCSSNQDIAVCAGIKYSKPIKTQGDLFKTGFAPLACQLDSMYMEFKHSNYTQMYGDDEVKGNQTRDVKIVYRNKLTGESIVLFSETMTSDEEDNICQKRHFIPLNSLILKNQNGEMNLIVDDHTFKCDYNISGASEFEYVQYFYDSPEYPYATEITLKLHTHPVEIQPALDVHVGMQKIYDAYRDILGYESYDNNHTPIYQLTNTNGEICGIGRDQAAAMASVKGKCVMEYGFGEWNGLKMSKLPHVSISTMGHEFTHMVQSVLPQGPLLYRFESGALNESFADIIGVSLANIALNGKDCKPELYFAPKSIIPKGTDCTGMADIVEASNKLAVDYRNFVTPALSGSEPQPEYYKGDNYKTATLAIQYNDNGYVHTNSGVQDHWYYLMVEGGDKTLPFLKSLDLVFQTLKYYTYPLTDYQDVYHLFKACAKYQQIDDMAFGQTEGNKMLDAVIDNWHKCGVGLDQDTDPSAMSTCTQDSATTTPKAYDLQGRQVNPLSFKGVYIMDGKKVVK